MAIGTDHDAVRAQLDVELTDETLPDATIVGASLAYDSEKFGVRFSVNNLLNELYFTPNSPDGLGEVIVIPAPERSYQTTFTFKF